MAHRIADELLRREAAIAENATSVKTKAGVGAGVKDAGGGGGEGGSTVGGTETIGEGEEGDGDGERRREGAYRRLESIGYRVGQGIVER